MRYEVRTSIQNWCNRNHIETIGKSGNSKLHLNTGGTNKLGYKNIEMHLAVNTLKFSTQKTEHVVLAVKAKKEIPKWVLCAFL